MTIAAAPQKKTFFFNINYSQQNTQKIFTVLGTKALNSEEREQIVISFFILYTDVRDVINEAFFALAVLRSVG